ncbi:geranylgeranylglyceryl/heptaprenylglyceryl phosphate synthase [Winogradskyella echinorum]|uniref:Geranylgeranylglyceryl phosphate synthase n=1 Tax=Winogradskyella echinorum TaxID=538189 RepID=A0ABR6XYE8_9FLAO|nr:geranylgeranylglyceryl/heptaprenylglyceryl phosphate synthase [Winogradskyella echinorum]MBC3845518.1 geranylgeranylglyceryl/heptaprenylglyceryl phosphate synthase [Winogradskyella echinorum]MBC5749866.1 geranylgeranylglyceryl/heptaprenylglyceryl phosphate synthase [Winogradskyella echinorum]
MKLKKVNILKSIKTTNRNLAVLIDPDKMNIESVSSFVPKINQSIATHIFVGGSEVDEGLTETLVIEIKKHTKLPVVLFPGDVIQITDKADGILFLSLISGRNPDYLIGKHVEAVSKLKGSNLEVIPTGYILIENGKETSVERVSQTRPLKRNNIKAIIDTAKAGELLGVQLIYLEAGSGATHAIEPKIIQKVKEDLNIPLIVGGGIRSKTEIELAYNSGADLVVIGTAFEENKNFFRDITKDQNN